MKDLNNKTTLPPAEPMPTDAEAWDIHCAIARGKACVPDADTAWQAFCDSRDTAGEEQAPRRQTPWRVLLTAAAAAACAAFFIWVQPRLADDSGAKETGSITLLSHTSGESSEVTMAAQRLDHGTQQAEQPLWSDAGRQVVSQKDISFVAANDADTTRSSVILMTTPRGKDCHLTLADGTRVWLNADSRLEFPERFSGARRTVRLSGEAYFEVAKDRRHPFVVESRYLCVTVLGTSFNMKAYSMTESSVTLVEGSLSVSPAVGGKAVVISPGQQLSLQKSALPVVQRVDTYAYTQRTQGYFYFHDATMRQIMTELGRWYNKTVVFEDAAQLDTRLHFVAERSQSLPQVINSLCELDGIDIELGSDDMTVK